MLLISERRGVWGENVYPTKTVQLTVLATVSEIGHIISEGESLSSGWVFNSQKSITKVTSRDKIQHPRS